MQKLAAGNEPAFSMLYKQFRPNIYTTALRMTNSVVIAEEVVQDVFLKLWKGRASAAQIISVKAYLHGIAAHVLSDALKRKYRENQQKIAAAASPLYHNETENAIIYKDYQAVLDHAISRLPNKQRQTYLLIKQKGLKREEVAQQLNVSPETVKWNLEQAMRSIRAYCGSQLDISLGILIIINLI